ncbi:anaphase-promoting complex subunit 5-like isoform X2 [Corticium candelabrum]|uniref:anaphase-promoting complex subunit 5-like isoform X2 n=1 Tax=Corticium candelabrum TaxID=121492 RepID=UPI002E274EC6|nr:anaphase-promoting complex subunit 5-like isoform X2 [Corticium candelabrum]
MAAREVCYLCLTRGLADATSLTDRNRLALWILRNIKDTTCSFESAKISLQSSSVSGDLIDGFLQRMEELKDNGINYLLDIIDSAEELISVNKQDESQSVNINRDSPIGVFIRQTILHVKKLDLHRLTDLYDDIIHYINGTDATHIEATESRQTDAFYPTEKDRALNDLANMVVESMDAENFSAALNGLQRYFDYNVKPLDKTNPNGLLAIHHAALGLALLHHYFGHMDQARMAVYECIRLSQAHNDADCLEHALSWLHVLMASDAPSSRALIETLEERAEQTKHTGIGILARLRHLSQIIKSSLLSPATVFREFEPSKAAEKAIFGVGTSSSGHVLQSTLWKRAGQRILSCLHDQQLLRDVDRDQLVLSANRAAALADHGHYNAALEHLALAKSHCTSKSLHSKIWMTCQQQVLFNRAVYSENWASAERAVHNITTLDSTEGCIREVILCLSKEDYAAAFEKASSCLHNILDVTESRELQLRLFLLMAEIHLGTGQLRVALDYASQCLTMSRCHHFGSLEMHAMLLLARIHIQVGQVNKSLGFIRTVMIDVLSQGSQFLIGLAHFTLAQIMMYSVTAEVDIDKTKWKSSCNAVIVTLDAALLAFRRIFALCYIRQVSHYQARVFHLMGCEAERNRCADEVRGLIG